MRTRLVAYASGDDALLLWTADVVDDGCQGFAIERRLRRTGATAETREWLDNYAPPFRTPRGIGRYQRSIEWPFRSFTWTDHEVGAGDVVSYRVVPVFESAPAGAGASRWSRLVEIGAPRSARYEPFFNRGFVISQFMSRYLDQHYKGLTRTQALRQFKADAARVEDRLRIFLSGDLRTRLLALLDEVRLGDGHLYAALFELGDAELANALAALGPRAHVVLANGSIEVRRDLRTKRALETAAQARARDENAALRRVLVDAGADVEERNRFVSPGSLAHNKFLVVTDARGNARRAWTGSTNWTTTGLCTQLNNALLVNHAGVAAAYLRQWHALRDAASAHPGDLAVANSAPTELGAGRRRVSVHFTRAKDRVDLKALGEIVRSARDGVLFLMFIPGAAGTLADVRELQTSRPELLVRGVVSELPRGRADEKTGTTTSVRVTVVGLPDAPAQVADTFEVVQPEGRSHPTTYWAAETTRREFLGAVGHAIIHSKVLVVDPFSNDPIVVTGSHNFSLSASSDNDENFIVVRGDRRLAEAYAVNIRNAWRHYASRVGNPHAKLRGVEYLRALLEDARGEGPSWRLA